MRCSRQPISWARVSSVLITHSGNASQPGSPHLGDQLTLFARNEMRQAWRTREEIAAYLETREVLTVRDVASSGTPAP